MPRKTLDPTDVREIREAHRDGEAQTALAREYGVSQQNIALVVRGATWTDAPGPIEGEDYPHRGNRGENHPQSELTPADVADIRREYRDTDATQAEIAASVGLGRSTVSEIISGEKWPDAPGPIRGEDY